MLLSDTEPVEDVVEHFFGRYLASDLGESRGGFTNVEGKVLFGRTRGRSGRCTGKRCLCLLESIAMPLAGDAYFFVPERGVPCRNFREPRPQEVESLTGAR
ncbi:hypothetical protein BAC2_03849 [uncultured bacterium]|nr:hypothetical protein BAC2_03849 [uncultured bacterium]